MNLPVSGNVTDLFGETSQRDLGGAGRGLPTVTIAAGDCGDCGGLWECGIECGIECECEWESGEQRKRRRTVVEIAGHVVTSLEMPRGRPRVK